MPVFFENLEDRRFLSVSPVQTPGNIAEPAVVQRVDKAATTSPFAGVFTGSFTDAVYGNRKARLEITVQGHHIVGKFYWNSTRRGPYLWDFDCKNSTFSTDAQGRKQFTLTVPPSKQERKHGFGNLVVTATVVGKNHLQGEFHGFWSNAAPFDGNFDVRRAS